VNSEKGGIFYIKNCENINFESVSVDLVETDGSGGFAYIEGNSVFSFSCCNFSNLKSSKFGGSLLFDCEYSEDLKILNCNFENNLATKSDGFNYFLGSDICDYSEKGISLYNRENVVNCKSNSEGIKFYLFAQALSLDCLLDSDLCILSEVFVSKNYGTDYEFCGSENSPCASIDVGFGISDKNSKLNIGEGIYVNNIIKNVDKDIEIRGPVSSVLSGLYKSVLENSEEENSAIIDIYNNLTDVESLISISGSGKLKLNSFKIIYNVILDETTESVLPLSIFVINSPESEIYLLSCSFLVRSGYDGIDEVRVLSPLIDAVIGIVEIRKCNFENIYLSEYPLIVYGGDKEFIRETIFFNIYDSLFENINIKSNERVPDRQSLQLQSSSVIFGSRNKNIPILINFIITNAEFLNIINYNKENSEDSDELNGGLISIFAGEESKVEIINSSFVNIIVYGNTNGGILYLNGSIWNVLIENINFTNVSGSNRGGVIYQSIEDFLSPNNYFNLSNITFENCTSKSEGFLFIYLLKKFFIINYRTIFYL
jgi:hypothetical protein